LIAVLALTGCVPSGAGRHDATAMSGDGSPVGAVAATTRARETYGSLPLLFVENRGQTDPRVTHYVQGGGATIFFTPTTVTHLLRAPDADGPAGPEVALLAGQGDPLGTPSWQAQSQLREPKRWQHWAVEVELVGAAPDVRPRATTMAPTVVSYFKGLETNWQTGLPTSTGIVYPDLWPGIDLVYESAAGQLKSSYVVRPGADPRQIVLAYHGASSVGLGEDGGLVVDTPLGGFRESSPFSYQDRDGARSEVAASSGSRRRRTWTLASSRSTSRRTIPGCRW
jgi:hypothetical protein